MKKVQQPNTILDALQAEISPEASPAVQFFIKHAPKIAAGLVLFILFILGTSVFQWQQKRDVQEAQNELGRILATTDITEQHAALETFAAKAPAQLQISIMLARISANQATGDYAQVAQSWDAVSKLDNTGMLGKIALLGKAEALAATGDYENSMQLLESLMSNPNENMASLAFTAAGKLTNIAQLAKQPARALTAAEFALNHSTQPAIWEQRVSTLRAQVAATGKTDI